MARRNGDGTWGKEKINGTEYTYLQKMYGYKQNGSPNLKRFRGKNKHGETARQEILRKKEKYEKSNGFIPDKKIQKQTLSEYIDWYMVEYKEIRDDSRHKDENVSEKTYDGYMDLLIYIKKNDIGNIQIGSFNSETYMTFQNYVDKLLEKLARSTVDKLLIVMNMAISQGVADGNIPINPLERVYLPKENDEKVKVKKKKIQYLKYEDREKLKEIAFATYDGEKYKGGQIGERIYGNNAIAILIIMYTGMRVGEFTGTEVCSIDLYNRKELFVEHQIVSIKSRSKSTSLKYELQKKGLKSEKGYRTIPLLDYTIELIEYFFKQFPYKKEHDLIFLNENGNPMNGSNLNRTLKSMLKRANCSVQDCSMHALRHSFGSIIKDNAEAIGENVDILTISRLLGHANIQTTANIYLHKSEKNMRKAVNYLEKSDLSKDKIKELSKNKIADIKEKVKLLGKDYTAYAKIEPFKESMIITDYYIQPKENTFPMSLENILSKFVEQSM
ncbi:MAG: site-specific integrase [Anaerostipes sp.]|nr:site-specific integrase [Anaerostipes sp.]